METIADKQGVVIVPVAKEQQHPAEAGRGR
jgi:regulator of RNase E activity RraA